MDKKEPDLQEQDAPLKNTDNAFVQVSEDESPSMPEHKETEETKPDTTTDLEHR